MKFKLCLWPPSIELETQPIEQVSTIDLITAVIGVMRTEMEPIVLVREDDTED